MHVRHLSLTNSATIDGWSDLASGRLLFLGENAQGRPILRRLPVIDDAIAAGGTTPS
jgi:hypothetical protein